MSIAEGEAAGRLFEAHDQDGSISIELREIVLCRACSVLLKTTVRRPELVFRI